MLDSDLSFSDHIQSKINKAYSMIGIINRNFKWLSISSFVLLYKCMVRSHLEYCNSVWAPYRKMDIEDLEKVQRRATKILPALKKLPYEERLKKCGLTTLKFRRLRGDMIEAYKIITAKYDNTIAPKLMLSHNKNTRGNNYKLETFRTRYDLRKYFFTNRVIGAWNSLPNHVIMACSVNNFKSRLDQFWKEQDMCLDYKADLTGAGDRCIKV